MSHKALRDRRRSSASRALTCECERSKQVWLWNVTRSHQVGTMQTRDRVRLSALSTGVSQELGARGRSRGRREEASGLGDCPCVPGTICARQCSGVKGELLLRVRLRPLVGSSLFAGSGGTLRGMLTRLAHAPGELQGPLDEVLLERDPVVLPQFQQAKLAGENYFVFGLRPWVLHGGTVRVSPGAAESGESINLCITSTVLNRCGQAVQAWRRHVTRPLGRVS